MEALLKSKKGCAALIACLFATYGMNHGWTIEQIAVISAPMTAYIGIQGAVDHRKAKVPAPAAEGKP